MARPFQMSRKTKTITTSQPCDLLPVRTAIGLVVSGTSREAVRTVGDGDIGK